MNCQTGGFADVVHPIDHTGGNISVESSRGQDGLLCYWLILKNYSSFHRMYIYMMLLCCRISKLKALDLFSCDA